VLRPRLTFEKLSFNPKDLALLETQEFDAKAIATAYGVPSVLLNMALQGGLTYQNPAALGEMWWRFELRPTATRIANAFSAQMLPRGQWVWLDAADTFAAICRIFRTTTTSSFAGREGVSGAAAGTAERGRRLRRPHMEQRLETPEEGRTTTSRTR
jgi:phage portal protein BeeE